MEEYKNEYWSRIISLNDFLPVERVRYELGPDLVIELEYMYRLDSESLP